MSYIVAALLMMSGPDVSSNVVWKWQSPNEGCALRQELNEVGSSVLVGAGGVNDRAMITFEDRRGPIKTWQAYEGAKFTFDPSGEMVVDGFIGPGEKPGIRVINASMPGQELLAKLSGATAIELTHEAFGKLRIPLRSTAAAVKALRECGDKDALKWGVDPIKLQSLRSRPQPTTSQAKWFTADDYPRIAAIYGVGGDVIVMLNVGTDGTVHACKIMNHPRLTDFRDATCETLKRNARFHPAIDLEGQPAEAPFIVHVRFQPNR